MSNVAARFVIDRGVRKAVKTCCSCGRDFTWRKKWERCWDEVKYCSKSCKRHRAKPQVVEECTSVRLEENNVKESLKKNKKRTETRSEKITT